jgi:hypothetical protein
VACRLRGPVAFQLRTLGFKKSRSDDAASRECRRHTCRAAVRISKALPGDYRFMCCCCDVPEDHPCGHLLCIESEDADLVVGSQV